jgi:glycosyltransferase involved in cell wall biosynthesis
VNVLCIIHYPVFGGPHNQALLVARSLARQGVQTSVVLSDDAAQSVERFQEAGIAVVAIPLHRLRATWNPVIQVRFLATFVREIQAIRELIRTRHINVVQIGGLANPHGAIAARLEGVPVVWQILDTRAPMAFRRLVMPVVRRLADVVMTTGRAVASVHPGAEKLDARLRVFFPPVDPDFFDPDAIDRGAARAEFGFGPDDLVVGVVGNLNPQKGHEYLLQAVAFCRATRSNVKLLIVGASHETHAGYERELHKLSGALGLVVGRDVIFAGGLADVRRALAAMDLFVLASVPRSEGAPTAIEEAMMMRRPVVATDVGAVRELVEDGRSGFVVPPRDPRRLSDAILRVLGDERLQKEFGSCGHERALVRFSADECARLHLDAYRLALIHRTGKLT